MRAPKIRMEPLSAVAVALTAALALTGCSSSGPATDGPLGGGAYGSISGGSVCVPGRVGQPRTFGIERFANHGHTTVVLDSVALLHPRNERLVGSYAVPGKFLIGIEDWPPKYAGIPSTWKDRQAVHGFRLAPGKTFNMVLGVEAVATSRANSQGMVIYYHDSEGRYVTSNDLAMITAVDKPQC